MPIKNTSAPGRKQTKSIREVVGSNFTSTGKLQQQFTWVLSPPFSSSWPSWRHCWQPRAWSCRPPQHSPPPRQAHPAPAQQFNKKESLYILTPNPNPNNWWCFFHRSKKHQSTKSVLRSRKYLFSAPALASFPGLFCYFKTYFNRSNVRHKKPRKKDFHLPPHPTHPEFSDLTCTRIHIFHAFGVPNRANNRSGLIDCITCSNLSLALVKTDWRTILSSKMRLPSSLYIWVFLHSSMKSWQVEQLLLCYIRILD